MARHSSHPPKIEYENGKEVRVFYLRRKKRKTQKQRLPHTIPLEQSSIKNLSFLAAAKKHSSLKRHTAHAHIHVHTHYLRRGRKRETNEEHHYARQQHEPLLKKKQKRKTNKIHADTRTASSDSQQKRVKYLKKAHRTKKTQETTLHKETPPTAGVPEKKVTLLKEQPVLVRQKKVQGSQPKKATHLTQMNVLANNEHLKHLLLLRRNKNMPPIVTENKTVEDLSSPNHVFLSQKKTTILPEKKEDETLSQQSFFDNPKKLTHPVVKQQQNVSHFQILSRHKKTYNEANKLEKEDETLSQQSFFDNPKKLTHPVVKQQQNVSHFQILSRHKKTYNEANKLEKEDETLSQQNFFDPKNLAHPVVKNLTHPVVKQQQDLASFQILSRHKKTYDEANNLEKGDEKTSVLTGVLEFWKSMGQQEKKDNHHDQKYEKVHFTCFGFKQDNKTLFGKEVCPCIVDEADETTLKIGVACGGLDRFLFSFYELFSNEATDFLTTPDRFFLKLYEPKIKDWQTSKYKHVAILRQIPCLDKLLSWCEVISEALKTLSSPTSTYMQKRFSSKHTVPSFTLKNGKSQPSIFSETAASLLDFKTAKYNKDFWSCLREECKKKGMSSLVVDADVGQWSPPQHGLMSGCRHIIPSQNLLLDSMKLFKSKYETIWHSLEEYIVRTTKKKVKELSPIDIYQLSKTFQSAYNVTLLKKHLPSSKEAPAHVLLGRHNILKYIMKHISDYGQTISLLYST